jgi:hypothetical protein
MTTVLFAETLDKAKQMTSLTSKNNAASEHIHRLTGSLIDSTFKQLSDYLPDE